MKKLLFSLLALATSFVAFAQKPAYDVTRGALLDGRNIVKVSPVAVAFKNYAFSYERILTKRLSLQLSYSTRPEGSFTQLTSLLGKEYQDATLGITTISPELRLYLGGGYGRGFYVAPYMRYDKLSVGGLRFNVSSSSGEASPAINDMRFSGEASAISGGLGLGVQFYIARVISVDLSVGAHYAPKAKMNLQSVLDATAKGLTDEELKDLENGAIDVAKYLPGKSALDFQPIRDTKGIRGAKAEFKAGTPLVRLDLSIGYRF